MRVLQINVVYKKGSTGKIIYDIHSCLSDQNIDSIVCYGRGYTINEDNVYKFCSEIESKFYHLLNLFGWLMYAVCPIATRKLINIIKNIGKNKELESVVVRLQMNMSNNYKDAAQAEYKALMELYKELSGKGGLTEKQKSYYKEVIEEYRVKMKDYTHKDQKPYWE